MLDQAAHDLLVYLQSRGDFAVISGLLAIAWWRTLVALHKNLLERIEERRSSEERMFEALQARTDELVKLREILASTTDSAPRRRR